MENKYTNIIEIISQWAIYESVHPQGSITGFAQWLLDINGKTPIEKSNGAENTAEHFDHLYFYKDMPPKRQFLTLLSRAGRFLDFYIRKALEELEINSALEFQFLIMIREMKNPRKTDIINFNLVELSTGVETLKRLQKKNLITDYADKKDKRVRRIQLTAVGRDTVEAALRQFDVLDQLVNTFHTGDHWKSFIPLLMLFNDHHTIVYQNHKYKSFQELQNYFRYN